jgi:hypothetical protein
MMLKSDHPVFKRNEKFSSVVAQSLPADHNRQWDQAGKNRN